jgi:hypothetical protein
MEVKKVCKTMIISTKETMYNYLGTIREESGKIEKEINQKIGKGCRLHKSLRSMFFGKKEVLKEIKPQLY